MDHGVVVRQKMTERYLLDELDSVTRNEFEEHFFDCPECALDVRAASLFVERSKVVLGEEAEKAPTPVPAPGPRVTWWQAWLRPATVLPVLALLLTVVGYENLVTIPRIVEALNSPRVLPWTSVNIGTFGSDGNTLTVPPGSGFLLFVRTPPDHIYPRYTADLYSPAGKLEWSLPLPAAQSQQQWTVQVPAANRVAGTYTLRLHGITSAGENTEIGQASFELQFQK